MAPGMRKARRRRTVYPYSYNVFINAPLDRKYSDIFDAIVFTAIDCGYVARCALEIDDGGEVRLEKIFNIIAECKFAVHDISRTQLDSKHKLPRFNMPLELGMFLGAKRFGRKKHKLKKCIILDAERYRYHKFISDISGQDPQAHDNDPETAVAAVRNWLITHATSRRVPSSELINTRYKSYRRELPSLCADNHWDHLNLTFKEKANLMYSWIKATPLK